MNCTNSIGNDKGWGLDGHVFLPYHNHDHIFSKTFLIALQ